MLQAGQKLGKMQIANCNEWMLMSGQVVIAGLKLRTRKLLARIHFRKHVSFECARLVGMMHFPMVTQ